MFLINHVQEEEQGLEQERRQSEEVIDQKKQEKKAMETNIKNLKLKIRIAEERKYHLRKTTKLDAGGEEERPMENMGKLHKHVTETAKSLGLDPGDNLPLEVLRLIEELMISVFEQKE